MNLTKLAAAAVLVASAGAAFAAPQAVNPGGSLGTNPDGVSFVGLANGVSTFYFDLVEVATPGFTTSFDLSADFWSVFAPATINGITVTGGSFSDTVVPASGSALFTGLSAGSYSISFDSTGSFGSFVTGTVTATAITTPVPEAGSMALALAGLGVVGLVASRRRKV
ncbi:PEP-CTERM sorting domain-containing protein [Aquabacterium sp. A3]|uniref:PEP-CTERM sorting domain-containing protein n=1 Tax=Aquabacterium sp. A3 TaxID=3132829 RepID=UPI00311A71DF